MAPLDVTNQDIAEKLAALSAQSAAQHESTSERLDALTLAVRTTNGQVQQARTDIAVIKAEQANDRYRIAALESSRQVSVVQPAPAPIGPDDGSKVSTKAVAVGLVTAGTIGGGVLQGIWWLAKWWFAK